MRIVDYIDHPIYKITIFSHEERYTVKFENGPLEQSYRYNKTKFIETPKDIKKMVDADYLTKVNDQFTEMNILLNTSQQKMSIEDDFEFDDIV